LAKTQRALVWVKGGGFKLCEPKASLALDGGGMSGRMLRRCLPGGHARRLGVKRFDMPAAVQNKTTEFFRVMVILDKQVKLEALR
jgi:hypothetical protein